MTLFCCTDEETEALVSVCSMFLPEKDTAGFRAQAFIKHGGVSQGWCVVEFTRWRWCLLMWKVIGAGHAGSSKVLQYQELSFHWKLLITSDRKRWIPKLMKHILLTEQCSFNVEKLFVASCQPHHSLTQSRSTTFWRYHFPVAHWNSLTPLGDLSFPASLSYVVITPLATDSSTGSRAPWPPLDWLEKLRTRTMPFLAMFEGANSLSIES